MGSSTMIDIVGSYIIAGILLTFMLNLDRNLTQANYTAVNDVVVQTNLVNAAKIIETDFRRIGYCANPDNIPDPSKAIISATQNGISFISDVNGDGTVDTVTYSVGTAATLTQTANPKDFMLYRKVKTGATSSSIGYSLGLTQFQFVYYNTLGDSLPFPITIGNVYEIRLT
ncbi:MAG TPA: hypothetical protein VKI62_08475, partial [Bacteroidota bacterium]|nr:hypothetical protein [Bacteroidota bacterium]